MYRPDAMKVLESVRSTGGARATEETELAVRPRKAGCASVDRQQTNKPLLLLVASFSFHIFPFVIQQAW